MDEYKIDDILYRGNESEPLYSWLGIDFIIYDFPGINDADDKFRELYESKLKSHRPELVIYFTDAKRAFTTSKEISDFNDIKSIVDDINKSGWYSH